MRACTECGTCKPEASFPKHGRRCKACVKKWTYDYKKRNADKIRAQAKAYHAANAEKRNARAIAWAKEHREELNAARRKRPKGLYGEHDCAERRKAFLARKQRLAERQSLLAVGHNPECKTC